MKLILVMDGNEKIFTPTFVSGRHHRKVLEFDQTIDYSDIELNQIDELIGFVCEVYGKQFTIDEFYDGIPSHQLISTIGDVFYYVRTGKDPEPIEGNDTGKS